MRDSLEQDRSTSPLLLIGIFFLPFIFAFFTLRKNHSLLIKLLSFSWLSFLLGYIVAAQTHLSQEKSAAPVSKTIVEKRTLSNDGLITRIGDVKIVDPTHSLAMSNLRLDKCHDNSGWLKDGSYVICLITYERPFADGTADISLANLRSFVYDKDNVLVHMFEFPDIRLWDKEVNRIYLFRSYPVSVDDLSKVIICDSFLDERCDKDKPPLP